MLNAAQTIALIEFLNVGLPQIQQQLNVIGENLDQMQATMSGMLAQINKIEGNPPSPVVTAAQLKAGGTPQTGTVS